MRIRIIFVTLWLSLLAPHVAVADTTSKFVTFNYNIKSISQSITDAQCEGLFKEPLYYSVANDRLDNETITYEKNTQYNISENKNIQTTQLNDSYWLFIGTETVTFAFNGKQEVLTKNYSLELNMQAHSVKGGWYVPGYCKSNFIGVQLDIDNWPPNLKTTG